MTLAITRADIEWFMTIPGTTEEEVERLKEKGVIKIEDEKDGN